MRPCSFCTKNWWWEVLGEQLSLCSYTTTAITLPPALPLHQGSWDTFLAEAKLRLDPSSFEAKTSQSHTSGSRQDMPKKSQILSLSRRLGLYFFRVRPENLNFSTNSVQFSQALSCQFSWLFQLKASLSELEVGIVVSFTQEESYKMAQPDTFHSISETQWSVDHLSLCSSLLDEAP